MSPTNQLEELRTGYYKLRRAYGPLIADVAAGIISPEKAAKLLKLTIPTVQRRAADADEAARKLIQHYRTK